MEDDIVPKGTKSGSWDEKNLTFFIYKACTYIQYICGVKIPWGREGPLGKRRLQRLLREDKI